MAERKKTVLLQKEKLTTVDEGKGFDINREDIKHSAIKTERNMMISSKLKNTVTFVEME